VPSWSAVARRIRVPLGFVFALSYLWLAKPTIRSLLLGAVFITVGLVIRGLASGHVRKNEQLTTTGPYAYTRNPLYLGSLVLAIGFAIAARSWWIAALVIAFFGTVYWPVILAEEAFLRQKFRQFETYAATTPRFLPRLTPSGGSTRTEFSWQLYRKHREYNALGGALGITLVLLVKLILE
jgi:protein-S-isoprenylcysteine O-methyltransferase Ste14